MSPSFGRVELTIHDFIAVWAALPQNRRVFWQLGPTVLAIPLFWLSFAWLKSDGPGEPAGMTCSALALRCC